jgi:soluble lytic murein transglycosylase-like protein
MSIAAAVGRVAELQALLGLQPPPEATPVAAAGAAPVAFDERLAQAQRASAPTPLPGAAVGATPYAPEIEAAAARHGIDPALLKALIRQESGFDPSAGSPAGAQGLTQLMPGTAASLGVSDPFDPLQSIDGGARYLRQQLDAFGGDVTKALAAYNAGPGAVRRYGGVPPYPETQGYVEQVQALAEGYRAPGASAAGASPAPVLASPASLPYSTV